MATTPKIDALQYNNWDRALFEQTRDAGVNAVHVTITYWETFRETVANMSDWHRQFRLHDDLIMPVKSASDIDEAMATNRVGIIFGAQNCSPIDDDLGLIQVMHELGLRIMQLTYNNQSLLATGCYEQQDSGVTRFGREAIKEMNRVGMIIDMSHSAEESTLQTIEISERPIAITHANPSSFHAALRNKSDKVLSALAESGGMLGFSMYPFHLANGGDCTLEEFCQMIARAADSMGIDRIGIGSDLCKNWGYDTLRWMRSGRWTADTDYGEGSADNAAWPQQPTWFEDVSGFSNLESGLQQQGFSEEECQKVLGGNWYRFFDQGFAPQSH